MYDVIVVGARCAGAATALLLARKGYKVLVVDKARFPSEVPRGHFVQRHGPILLQRWGVLDKIVQSGCPPVTKMATDFGDFPLVGIGLVRDGVALGYAPRRRVLDTILVEDTIASGAEFRDGFAVDDYIMDGAAMTGIQGRSYKSGARVDERARIIIGADGRYSSRARAVWAPEYEKTPPLTCWYFSYWSGAAVDGLEVYLSDRNAIFIFPTNDGLTAVFIGWQISEFMRGCGRISRAISCKLWIGRRDGEKDFVPAGKQSDSMAPPMCLTFFASRTAVGGRWSAMVLAMPCGTQICSHRLSMKDCPGGGFYLKLWQVTNSSATRNLRSYIGRISAARNSSLCRPNCLPSVRRSVATRRRPTGSIWRGRG